MDAMAYILIEGAAQAVLFGSLRLAEWSIRFARILCTGDAEPNHNSKF